jgi:thioredoxin reductase
MATTQQIVIIGHGLSGCTVAQQLVALAKKHRALTSEIKIMVIDSRDFYEADALMTFSLMQNDDEVYDINSCLQWQLKVEGVSEYKKDTVQSVARRDSGFTVLTSDGTSINADVVVCATGFTIPMLKPATGAEWGARKEEIAELRRVLGSAKNVVVAGSGNAGVDFAGEVRQFVDTAGGCKVHLICSSDLVLNESFGAGDRQQLTDKIRRSPGMVLHTDRVTGDFRTPSLSPSTVTLKSGKTIEADVYLPCFAQFVAGTYLSEIDGATLPNGQVAVDHESLEATAAKGLFAIGCSDIVQKEGHISMPKIEGQCKTVAANVLAHLVGSRSVVHKEGMGFTKHDLASNFGIGHHTQIHTEKCGCPGFCVRYCCGFPLPCLFGCWCCGCAEGPCGYTCCRPAGRGPSKAVEKFARGGKVAMIALAKQNVKKGLVQSTQPTATGRRVVSV